MSGMCKSEILADFPDLEQEDIRASLAFADDRECRLVSLSPVRKGIAMTLQEFTKKFETTEACLEPPVPGALGRQAILSALRQ